MRLRQHLAKLASRSIDPTVRCESTNLGTRNRDNGRVTRRDGRKDGPRAVRWLRDDCFKGASLRLHADMRIVLQHLLRNVARYITDRFVAGAALSEISDEGVPIIVPASLNVCLLSSVAPRRF
jgi:hypothetical protein